MAVLHRTAIGGGEEQHRVLTEQLTQVVVEIGCFFLIVAHDEEKIARGLRSGSEHHGGGRTAQTFQAHARAASRQLLAQSEHAGMMIEERQ